MQAECAGQQELCSCKSITLHSSMPVAHECKETSPGLASGAPPQHHALVVRPKSREQGHRPRPCQPSVSRMSPK